MTWWGDRFVNLGELVDVTRRTRAAATEAADTRRALEAALSDRARLGGGGVLYVPPYTAGMPGESPRRTAWVVDVTRPLVIPASVTVVMTAGARVIPLITGPDADTERATLEIAGALEAPLTPLFGTRASRSLWRPDLVGEAPQVGRVRLTSAWLEAVDTTWWGGGDGDPARDTDALEAAFAAACDGRVELEPLTVHISRGLHLLRALHVVSVRRRGATVTLRGLRSRSLPTLGAAAGAQPEALLVTDGSLSLALEDVTLDGLDRVERCVALAVTARTRHRITRCELRGALHHLVSVAPSSLPTLQKGVAAEREPALVVEASVFRPVRAQYFATDSAVRVERGVSSAVSVHGSVFVGKAGAMIHAQGEALSVTQCEFENAAWPQTAALDDAEAPSQKDTESTPWHARWPEGGVDVYLAEGAGALSMTGCGSTSVQVLVARRGGGTALSLVSVRHVPWERDYDSAKPGAPHARDRPRDAYPPAVDVGEGSGLRDLTLAGCVFHRRAGDDAVAVRMRDPGGRAVDLGTSLLVARDEAPLVAAARWAQAEPVDVPVPPRTQS